MAQVIISVRDTTKAKIKEIVREKRITLKAYILAALKIKDE
jgi:hypothetical protein